MSGQPASRYLIGSLPWYSVLIVCGMALAILLACREEKRRALPRDTVIDLALVMLPVGIIGARVYYVIFSWDMFAAEPIRAIYIHEGGLAIYGGIIAGAAAVLLFAKRRRISPALLLDTVICGVPLAQAVGRWGNYFNMEAYGEVIENAALQFFPIAVLVPEGDAQVWHQATFFYESCWDLLVFLTLWTSRKKARRAGDLAYLYGLLYGAGRLTIEGLRTDSLMSAGGTMRVSQILSAAVCLAVCVLFAVRALQASRLPKLTTVMFGLLGAVLLSLRVPTASFPGIAVFAALGGGLCFTAAPLTALEESGAGRLRAAVPLLAALADFAYRRRLAAVEPGAALRLIDCLLLAVMFIAAGSALYRRTPAARSPDLTRYPDGTPDRPDAEVR